jgi:excinuclease ABC subunit B
MEETERRRAIQEAYNEKHRITPRTIQKNIVDIFDMAYETPEAEPTAVAESVSDFETGTEVEKLIASLEADMQEAAKKLAFEEAAKIRDRIRSLKKRLLFET